MLSSTKHGKVREEYKLRLGSIPCESYVSLPMCTCGRVCAGPSREIEYQTLSRFSACIIEKLGGAWGRGYIDLAYTCDVLGGTKSSEYM